jgi:hypothetical protein
MGQLQTADSKCQLHARAEQWERNELRSYAIVVIMADGTVNVDFDLNELSPDEIGRCGAGTEALYKQLCAMQVQAAVKARDAARAAHLVGLNGKKLV